MSTGHSRVLAFVSCDSPPTPLARHPPALCQTPLQPPLCTHPAHLSLNSTARHAKAHRPHLQLCRTSPPSQSDPNHPTPPRPSTPHPRLPTSRVAVPTHEPRQTPRTSTRAPGRSNHSPVIGAPACRPLTGSPRQGERKWVPRCQREPEGAAVRRRARQPVERRSRTSRTPEGVRWTWAGARRV